MKCHGVKISGCLVGQPCQAQAPVEYELRGKHYCGTHYAMAKKNPDRFKAAKLSWERRVVRLARQALEAKRQLDAFDPYHESEAEREIGRAYGIRL